MLTQTNIKKENKQLPAFSMLVPSVFDITESVKFTSQGALTGWFVANVVDLGYFLCILVQLEAPTPSPLRPLSVAPLWLARRNPGHLPSHGRRETSACTGCRCSLHTGDRRESGPDLCVWDSSSEPSPLYPLF